MFTNVLKAETTYFFVVRAVGRIISSRSVGKIIIVSFRVHISKNKNIDHRAKETCAIMSTQGMYEIDLSLYSVIQQYQKH